MKTRNFLALLLFVSGMLAFGTTKAQGTFSFTNNTSQAVKVTLIAAYDDCVTNICTDGPVTIAAGATHNFTGCTSGAWKDIRIEDTCGKAQVGVCFSPGTSTPVTLCSGTYTLDYIDEHNGEVN